mmetsp:Transcript_6544/g.10520  ORF Transcript_6544/g.10520 Transcript_6544/m.10520 type:complete len:104 (+) Transcript_6544:1-312(+)
MAHNLSIRWLGHAGFKITFSDPKDASLERVIYIDTWLQNPKLPKDMEGAKPEDADLVLVTHGHFDHSASAPDLVLGSKKEHVKVVSNFEICLHYQKHCNVPEA